MAENAWKYGWLMSYPQGEGGALFSDATCFHYEPWHYRYLGREIARKVHRSGLTIREYLWKHYTLVDPRTGEPIATPTPTPSPTPIPTPIPTSTATPTTVPSATMPSATGSATAAPSAASPTASGGLLGIDPLVFAALGVAVVVLAGVAFAARRGSSPG